MNEKLIKKEKPPTLENYSNLDLIYNSNYSSYKFYHYFNDLDKFNNLKHKKEKQRIKIKMCII